MKHAIATFFLFCATWLVWSGHTDRLLLIFGACSCAVVLYLGRQMQILDREGLPYQLIVRWPVYLIWLFVQIIKSNLTVARLILHPRLPLSQRLIYVRHSQRTPAGVVSYANSITLTPGTVTLDVRDGRMLVHALTEEIAYDLAQGKMDRRASWLEGHT